MDQTPVRGIIEVPPSMSDAEALRLIEAFKATQHRPHQIQISPPRMIFRRRRSWWRRVLSLPARKIAGSRS